MDVSLSELRELVKDREAWRAAIHEVAKSRTRLSDWSDLIWKGNTDHNEILTKKPSFNSAFYFVHVLKAERNRRPQGQFIYLFIFVFLWILKVLSVAENLGEMKFIKKDIYFPPSFKQIYSGLV